QSNGAQFSPTLHYLSENFDHSEYSDRVRTRSRDADYSRLPAFSAARILAGSSPTTRRRRAASASPGADGSEPRLGRKFAMTHQLGRYRDEADMRGRHAPTGSGALDPKRSNAGPESRTAPGP